MVKTFSLNADNDIFIGIDGNLSISTGIDAVVNACQNVAQTRLGEMVLEIDEGLPYFEAIFIGSPNVERFRSELRKTLIAVDGVLKVLDVAFSRIDKDVLEYQAIIVTSEGQRLLNVSTTI